MVTEWLSSALADACASIDYGLTASAADHQRGPKFLRITDIVSGHIDWNSVPHVEANEATFAKYKLQDGDIVLARTGASTGASAYIKNPPPAVFASYLVRLQAKPNFDSRFLSYYLRSDTFWNFIRAVLGDKSAQPNASASTMTKAPLQAPRNKDEQRAIAHILGTLDDKIELNRGMSETLEAMARAIYKSWFVDFDPVHAKASGEAPESICRRLGLTPDLLALFPGRFGDSELGEVPEGWKGSNLGAVCRRVAMGPFGSDIKTSNFVPEGVPVIRGGNLTAGFVDDGFAFVTEAKADELRNANAWSGDIVITHRGTLGQVGLIPPHSTYPRYVVSQSQMVLTTNGEVATPRFVYEFLRTPQGQQALLANTSQVGVPAIARPTTSVKAIALVMPPVDLQRTFDQVVGPLFDRARCSSVESRTLAAVRDTLLPELLSGELRVPLEGAV